MKKYLIYIYLLLKLCAIASAQPVAEMPTAKSRYELLFQILELGVPEPKFDFKIGQEIEGDIRKISLFTLNYWAQKLIPIDKNEEDVAVKYLDSKIKEVRLISAWALMGRLNLRKMTMPDNISPMHATNDLESAEHKQLKTYLIEKLTFQQQNNTIEK